jgi:dephospho-CoA kinase
MSSTPELQRARLMKRDNITREKLERLIARQMPDAEKRARADFVVDTSGEISEGRAQLDVIVAQLMKRNAKAYTAHWA